MIKYVILICIILLIWISFEMWLVVRDRMQGKGKTGNDRGTRYFNGIALFLGITIAGIIHGNATFFFPGGRSEIGFWIGLCIMLMGFGLRIWAVVTLGVSFRTTVETHTEQRVIRTGPYRILRHPSYTGLILVCFGFGIAVQNWLSLAFAVVLPLIALIYRIHIEELTLVASIGSDYKEYQTQTKKLIPWVW